MASNVNAECLCTDQGVPSDIDVSSVTYEQSPIARVSDLLDEVYGDSTSKGRSEYRAYKVLEHYEGREGMLVEVLEEMVASRRAAADQTAEHLLNLPVRSCLDNSTSFDSIDPDAKDEDFFCGGDDDGEGLEIQLGKGVDKHYYAANRSDVMRRIKQKMVERVGRLGYVGSLARATSIGRVRSLGPVGRKAKSKDVITCIASSDLVGQTDGTEDNEDLCNFEGLPYEMIEVESMAKPRRSSIERVRSLGSVGSSIGRVGSRLVTKEKKTKSRSQDVAIITCIASSDLIGQIDGAEDDEDLSDYEGLPSEMVEVESVAKPRRSSFFGKSKKGSPTSMKTANVTDDGKDCDDSSEDSSFARRIQQIRTFEDSVVSQLSFPGLETPEGVMNFEGLPAGLELSDDEIFPESHSRVSFVAAPPSDPISSGLIPNPFPEEDRRKGRKNLNFRSFSFRRNKEKRR